MQLFENKWDATLLIESLEARILELELEHQDHGITTARAIQACRARIAECQRFVAESRTMKPAFCG